jgi:hypothetical protein
LASIGFGKGLRGTEGENDTIYIGLI